MIKIEVENGNRNIHIEGKPLDLMSELTAGTVGAIQQITKDCPDEHFAGAMKKSFIEALLILL